MVKTKKQLGTSYESYQVVFFDWVANEDSIFRFTSVTNIDSPLTAHLSSLTTQYSLCTTSNASA